MPASIAFLRAINLGANRKFPKDDIRRVVESVGFENVETHINTGNVRFDTRMRARPRIEQTLERAFHADRGFDVPTLVFTPAELTGIVRDGGALAGERRPLARHYVYLLRDEPDTATTARIEATSTDAGEMVVRGRAAHALLYPGYQDGVVDPLGAVKLLGDATNRNLTVLSTIVGKWC